MIENNDETDLLILYGIFTIGDPHLLTIEMVGENWGMIPAFLDSSDAFNHVRTKIDEQDHKNLFVDIITVDEYIDTKRWFDENYNNGLLTLRLIEKNNNR